LWQTFSPEPLAGRKILLAVFPDSVQALQLSAANDEIHRCGVPATDQSVRLPECNKTLAGAKIAVLGAGSMGSKVATSLARSGAREFLIVDDDIVRDGNLVRNDLDWRAVGAHKAEALGERLTLVHPAVKARTLLRRLGGQMSVKTLQLTLDDLSGSDLIVDTTGSDICFNYAAAVAERARIPMVWGRVLAGGYGGYVARSRPGVDPDPHSAREQIDVWCSNPEFPPAPAAAASDYGAEQESGPPMIADDADVSIISGHLSRLAIDLLTKPQHSDYPSSAYMIGLRAEWIFCEPFATFGIPLVRLPESEAAPDIATDVGAAMKLAVTILRDHA
jgi:molybdopterin/thiamine biosynthesis adenylyltransferase